MSVGGQETSQTLDRGLRVLELVAASPGGLSVTALAQRLELSRPVVYRLVNTLAAHHLVGRTEDGLVRLGTGLARLQPAVRPMLVETARPVVAALADAAGATAHLTVADGDTALALLVVEPTWTDLHVAYRVGARHPLARGAAGRAILALRAGERTPVHSRGELQAGADGVAAPVVGVPGLEASVGIVSLAPIDDEDTGRRVGEAAAALAAALLG